METMISYLNNMHLATLKSYHGRETLAREKISFFPSSHHIGTILHSAKYAPKGA